MRKEAIETAPRLSSELPLVFRHSELFILMTISTMESFVVMLLCRVSIVTLSVVILNVVMPSIGAP